MSVPVSAPRLATGNGKYELRHVGMGHWGLDFPLLYLFIYILEKF